MWAVAILLLTACGSHKKVTKVIPVFPKETTPPPKGRAKPLPPKGDSGTENPSPVKPAEPKSEPAKPPVKPEPPKPAIKSFTMAVLLPFNAADNSLDLAGETILEKSRIALEFYSGVNMALEELKNENISFHVKVLDSKNDVFTTKQALSAIDKNTDIIIGPIYAKETLPVAEFALANKIPCVSPLSPGPESIANNPYFIAVNPSINVHLKKIYDHLISSEKTSKIYVICDNEATEIKMANEFMALAGSKVAGESYTPFPEIEKIICDGARNCIENLQASFTPGIDNYVVVCSMREMYVNKMVSILSNMDGSFPLTVYGMPNWHKFETLNLAMLNSIHLRYTTTYWKDEQDPKSASMDQQFYHFINTYPSDIAVKGYEITRYFGKMMGVYGDDFIHHLDRNASDGYFQRFKFAPAYYRIPSTTTSPDYIENKHLYLIGYDNYTLHKL